MDANEIDQIFLAFETSNYEKIIQMADMDTGEENIDVFLNSNSAEVLKKIMKKIENGDVAYFCTFMQKKKDAFFQLLEYTSGIENLKEVIEDSKKIQELSPREIRKLIIATRDSTYIKSILESKERRQQLGIDINSEEMVDKFNNLRDLIIATKDEEYIKSIIENEAKRKEYRLNSDDIERIIIELNDTQYIKEIINNEKARKKVGLYVYPKQMIIATKDPEYIKSIIADKNKYDQIRDFFMTSDGLLESAIVDLIIATKDLEYIKESLENDEIQEFLYTEADAMKLLMATNDKEYLKKIIEDEEKIKKFGLRYEEIIQLIANTDSKYIEEILENEEKRTEYGLSDEEIKNLILKTRDKEYIKKIIENEEKRKLVGLEEEYIDSLVVATDEEYIKQYIEKIITSKGIKIPENRRKIDLPSNMTIGVEIESEGENFRLIKALSKFYLPGWKGKGDSSLTNGVEIVSPILTGDMEKVTQEIRTICNKINRLGQTISENCGAHIHIGADYLTTAESWRNLDEITGNTERILYLISNKEGEIPREGICQYAKPFSGKLEEILNKGEVCLQTEEDLKKLVKDAQEDDRYYGINYTNIGTYKNTIEFRYPNGTIDADTWTENINLFGGIVKTAEELAKIQLKGEETRTEEEKEKLELLENLKLENNSEEEKVEILLKLVVSKENKEIYMNRYKVNNELIKQNEDMDKEISSQVASRAITTQKVAKRVFGENDGINGQEYRAGNEIISRNLQNERNTQLNAR